jgi:hypothetical protein
MADPLASSSDLAAWLRVSFSAADEEWADLLLDAVSVLVRSERPELTWTPVPDLARVVTLEVAARVWRNPDAATSVSVSTGPFGKSLTFADPRAVGLYLSSDDKAQLARIPGARIKGLHTISTTRVDPETNTVFVPTVGGPEFPWYPGGDIP